MIHYKLTPFHSAKLATVISLLSTPSLWVNYTNSPWGLQLPSLFHIKTLNVFINWNGNKANQVSFRQHFPPTQDIKQLLLKSLLTPLEAAHPQLSRYPGGFSTFPRRLPQVVSAAPTESPSKGPLARAEHQFIHSTHKQVMPLGQVVLGECQEAPSTGAEG